MATVSQVRGKKQPESRTIAAGEFKAKCLQLLNDVAEMKQELIVTKHGKPVAKVIPIAVKPIDIVGAMKGSVLWEGDIISPLDVEWEANK